MLVIFSTWNLTNAVKAQVIQVWLAKSQRHIYKVLPQALYIPESDFGGESDARFGWVQHKIPDFLVFPNKMMVQIYRFRGFASQKILDGPFSTRMGVIFLKKFLSALRTGPHDRPI